MKSAERCTSILETKQKEFKKETLQLRKEIEQLQKEKNQLIAETLTKQSTIEDLSSCVEEKVNMLEAKEKECINLVASLGEELHAVNEKCHLYEDKLTTTTQELQNGWNKEKEQACFIFLPDNPNKFNNPLEANKAGH